MRRAAILTAVLIAVIAAVAVPLHAADVTGTWSASFDTQIGVQNYTYEFKVAGTQLTGTATSDNGQSALKNGKVDGDKISFVETLVVMGMELEVSYQGTVVSNDEIKFTRDVAGIATEELVAKRVK
jgi:hypothetical protein